MLAQNIREYEIIRQTMEAIRHRLTTHLSFAIGGSGIIYLAINSFEKQGNDSLTIGMICAFSATLLSAFFYLALYKYNSVNRYAGYCKLINLEIFAGQIHLNNLPENSRIPQHLITWEVCMSRMANAAEQDTFDEHYWKKLKYTGPSLAHLRYKFNEFSAVKSKADKKSTTKGFRLLFKKMKHSRSWRYPLYVSYIYYLLVLFFLSLAVMNVIDYWMENFVFTKEIGLIALLAYIVCRVLITSFGELYKLMEGSHTVSAYCWKFLPHRIEILNEFNIKPKYVLTEKSPIAN